MSEKTQAEQLIKIEAEIAIDAPPEKVFEAVTTGLGNWFPFASRKDAKVVYEPKVGGLIYEDWGSGKGLVYARVEEYDPPHRSVSLGEKYIPAAAGEDQAAFHTRDIEVVEPDGKGGSIFKKTILLRGVAPEALVAQFSQGAHYRNQLLKDHLEKGKQ